MIIEEHFTGFLVIWSLIGMAVFVALFFKVAPYGRYTNPKPLLQISSKSGWILMESPSIIGIVIFFILFYEKIGLVETLFCTIWLIHYFHRTLIWPFRARLKDKKMPIGIALLAFVFNTVNVSTQCVWIFLLGEYSQEWISSPQFIIGISIFAAGMYINVRSDNILMNLREENDKGYHTPKGFLYKYVSCPNYLGEIIEWLGWAILTLSPAGLVFLIWTFANLVPRAKANHRWALDNIDNYPNNRKAIFPLLY